ncbi:MAG: aspartate kinase, partial [Phycisphaerae bacterium]
TGRKYNRKSRHTAFAIGIYGDQRRAACPDSSGTRPDALTGSPAPHCRAEFPRYTCRDMPIIVQKFGGTSVADAARIRRAAVRAIAAQESGHQVVLVVSAMGHETDRLVDLAAQISRKPAKRELDMLLSTGEQVSIALVAMAIQEAGRRAISLTGGQAGMRTDSDHSAARIQSIDADRIHKLLDAGQIVIVAGFQGVDEAFNITTLGRGGSDTTAVALAAALKAETCEIYTDVNGIYTSDPRFVASARLLPAISYDEMLEMASLGAGVMHGRSIELAKKYSVPIHVRCSFTDEPGTIIMHANQAMEDVAIRGVTLKRDITRITFVGLPNRPGVVSSIFDEIARRDIFVDDIMQNVGGTVNAPAATLGFTVTHSDLDEVRAAANDLAKQLEVARVDVNPHLARLSVVGVGMRSHRGVAATCFAALAKAGINVENITTSEIVISVLVPKDHAERALLVLHDAFHLEPAAP